MSFVFGHSDKGSSRDSDRYRPGSNSNRGGDRYRPGSNSSRDEYPYSNRYGDSSRRDERGDLRAERDSRQRGRRSRSRSPLQWRVEDIRGREIDKINTDIIEIEKKLNKRQESLERADVLANRIQENEKKYRSSSDRVRQLLQGNEKHYIKDTEKYQKDNKTKIAAYDVHSLDRERIKADIATYRDAIRYIEEYHGIKNTINDTSNEIDKLKGYKDNIENKFGLPDSDRKVINRKIDGLQNQSKRLMSQIGKISRNNEVSEDRLYEDINIDSEQLEQLGKWLKEDSKLKLSKEVVNRHIYQMRDKITKIERGISDCADLVQKFKANSQLGEEKLHQEIKKMNSKFDAIEKDKKYIGSLIYFPDQDKEIINRKVKNVEKQFGSLKKQINEIHKNFGQKSQAITIEEETAKSKTDQQEVENSLKNLKLSDTVSERKVPNFDKFDPGAWDGEIARGLEMEIDSDFNPDSSATSIEEDSYSENSSEDSANDSQDLSGKTVAVSTDNTDEDWNEETIAVSSFGDFSQQKDRNSRFKSSEKSGAGRGEYSLKAKSKLTMQRLLEEHLSSETPEQSLHSRGTDDPISGEKFRTIVSTLLQQILDLRDKIGQYIKDANTSITQEFRISRDKIVELKDTYKHEKEFPSEKRAKSAKVIRSLQNDILPLIKSIVKNKEGKGKGKGKGKEIPILEQNDKELEKFVHQLKRNSEADAAEKKAREIGKALYDYSKKDWIHTTIGVAYMLNPVTGEKIKVVSVNEGGLTNEEWIKNKLNEMYPSEECLWANEKTKDTRTKNDKKHAEEVLIKYQEKYGLEIVGIGASRDYCTSRPDGRTPCSELLREKVKQLALGQIPGERTTMSGTTFGFKEARKGKDRYSGEFSLASSNSMEGIEYPSKNYSNYEGDDYNIKIETDDKVGELKQRTEIRECTQEERQRLENAVRRGIYKWLGALGEDFEGNKLELDLQLGKEAHKAFFVLKIPDGSLHGAHNQANAKLQQDIGEASISQQKFSRLVNGEAKIDGFEHVIPEENEDPEWHFTPLYATTSVQDNSRITITETYPKSLNWFQLPKKQRDKFLKGEEVEGLRLVKKEVVNPIQTKEVPFQIIEQGQSGPNYEELKKRTLSLRFLRERSSSDQRGKKVLNGCA